MENNPVMFVSLGPAEAELITLKGYRILQQADMILCPATTKNGDVSSRAADVLRKLAVSDDKISLFPLQMSKDRSLAMQVYDRMCDVATKYNRAKLRVVVVAEGDAGFYSSIHYVYDKLHSAGIPVSCIPGIPAFVACGAVGGLHIVQQEERLMIIPGNAKAEELTRLLASGVTVVIMKLSQCVDEIHKFISQNPAYHYHYFENVGTEEEYYTHCTNELSGRKFPYFSLMIIRKHCLAQPFR
jgi:precorrin-2/cobalt-factor-2 C20-methyltransferase